jgi:hypothetical protein
MHPTLSHHLTQARTADLRHRARTRPTPAAQDRSLCTRSAPASHRDPATGPRPSAGTGYRAGAPRCTDTGAHVNRPT